MERLRPNDILDKSAYKTRTKIFRVEHAHQLHQLHDPESTNPHDQHAKKE